MIRDLMANGSNLEDRELFAPGEPIPRPSDTNSEFQSGMRSTAVQGWRRLDCLAREVGDNWIVSNHLTLEMQTRLFGLDSEKGKGCSSMEVVTRSKRKSAT
jgi:hypothetical protein